MKAVVLLSGGIDSCACLAKAIQKGYECVALTIDYGQKNFVELGAARKIAEFYRVEHKIVRIDMRIWGGSALTDVSSDLPLDRDDEGRRKSPKAVYVPFRNSLFLSVGVSFAEAVGASSVYIGIGKGSPHPDTTPEFLEAFSNLVRVGSLTKPRVKIVAPGVNKYYFNSVKTCLELQAPLQYTWSCYNPVIDSSFLHGYAPCGRCDACSVRAEAFKICKASDPALQMVMGF